MKSSSPAAVIAVGLAATLIFGMGLATFVTQYGQHVRDIPEDTAFNRLAWLLPYALAGVGLVVIVMNARRVG